MRNSRDPSIDTLRGLACLLLVALHVIGEAPSQGLRVLDDHPLALFAQLFFHLRMPLFAMLSGFVYAARPVQPGQVGTFTRGKARRLVAPFVFAATTFALIMTVTSGSWAIEPARFWTIYLQPYAQFWFLQALILIFCAVAFVDLALPRRPQTAAFVFLAVSASAFLSPLGRGVEWMSLDRAIYLAPFFGFGLIMARLESPSVRRVALVGVALALVLFAFHALTVFAGPDRDIARRTGLALGLGLTLSGTLLAFRFTIRPFARIGTYSFSIYLYHLFAVMSLQLAYQLLTRPDPYIGLALGLAAGIAIPILLHEIVLRLGGGASFMLLGLRSASWREKQGAAAAIEPPSSKSQGFSVEKPPTTKPMISW
ncbi:acyltransferase [Marinicauda pacifica]|uniref:Acyltransferase n=1 Tax=Marinicauda pacifica TaxID=1133559 RepID=A0A4S2HGT0_9PROT|nr:MULTISPECIES: acyltransferase [Marinicauda]TGY94812.1 acyltransferase [Marinicauda pacifica]GGE39053.1 acyltransferase [Marinicauda pacifica]